VQEQVIAIAGTFMAEPIEDSLAFWIDQLEMRARLEFAPYNQVFQQVLDAGSLFARNQHGVNVLLVRPEDWLRRADRKPVSPNPSMQRKLLAGRATRRLPNGMEIAHLNPYETDYLYNEIFGDQTYVAGLHEYARAFAVGVRAASARWAVPSIVCICPASRAVMADPQLASALDDVEAQLAADLAGTAAVDVVRPGDVAAKYPISKYDDVHAESIGHIPYALEWFAAVGTLLARKIAAMNRLPFKVITLDCDDTLWRGICGEVGPLGVEIDAPRTALQQFVLEQHRAGMLVCLCSANNEADVFAVFDQRGDMLLERDHLAAWRINWRPKSENLKALAAELQLGLESFIHLDDDPVACADVRANCPQVLTLQLPQASEEIPRFLSDVWAFDRATLTDEDRKRTALYQENRARERARQSSLSFADFIAGLGLEVTIAPVPPQDFARASQLTLRTNQFNCTTIRRSERDLQALSDTGALETLGLWLSDRFGDYGLVGLLLFRAGEEALEVDTFLLSCRALGRGVEHRMLATLGEIARVRGLASVDILFVPTAKNRPALEFLVSVGERFRQPFAGGGVFRIPAEHAAAVRFNPGAEPPAAPRDSEPHASVASASPVDPSEGSHHSALVHRVATELRSVDQIVGAIHSRRLHVRPELATGFVPPRTPIEEKLVGIWTNLLNVDRVGVDDDFVELGGHSLLATVLLSRVRDAFDVEIALHDFFAAPTVASLAGAVEQGQLDRADETALARALDRVGQLSDEHVRALLIGERG
jgi:FkbH-like protein